MSLNIGYLIGLFLTYMYGGVAMIVSYDQFKIVTYYYIGCGLLIYFVNNKFYRNQELKLVK